MKRLDLFILAFAFLILGTLFVSAEDLNITQQQTAENCLLSSERDIADLVTLNISINRFNDTYHLAKNLYDAQLILTSKKSKSDFSQVISYCDKIKELKKTAIDAYDSFKVFMNFYKDTVDPNMDSSSVEKIIQRINEEFSGERYENVAQLIDEGYAEITKVRSEQTTLNLAYKVTTKKFQDFFKENWISLTIALVIIIILYIAYRTKVTEWLLKKKLNSLLLRRDTLKKLIGDTQREYFQTGSIAESDYRIRTKNFADLIRDIDRQIPLLQKELMNFSKKEDLAKLEERDKRRK